MARWARWQFEFLDIAVALGLGRDEGSVKSLQVVLKDVPNEALKDFLKDLLGKVLRVSLTTFSPIFPVAWRCPSRCLPLDSSLFLVTWGVRF